MKWTQPKRASCLAAILAYLPRDCFFVVGPSGANVASMACVGKGGSGERERFTLPHLHLLSCSRRSAM
jgi:hypothetical protein